MVVEVADRAGPAHGKETNESSRISLGDGRLWLGRGGSVAVAPS